MPFVVVLDHVADGRGDVYRALLNAPAGHRDGPRT
jgi:hypothetical protein